MKCIVMVDYVKVEVVNVEDINLYIDRLKQNKNLDFRLIVSETNGDIDESMLIAKYKDLRFKISNKKTLRLFIDGSLPKYYYGNNYQNFTYSDFGKMLTQFEDEFGINPEFLNLQNVEFGACIDIGDLNPTDILLNEVIDYKAIPKEIRTYRGDGCSLTFPQDNYVVKLYDKGRQCKLKVNAFKFEIRVKKMIHLKDLGINTLLDLNDKKKWARLKDLLIKVFKDIKICRYDGVTKLTSIEELRYISGTNHQYWLRLWPDSKSYENNSKDKEYEKAVRRYYRLESEFITLIENYGFDKHKSLLLTNINNEIEALINS